MENTVSDLDLLYPAWWNKTAAISGALVSMAASFALAKLSEAFFSRIMDWNERPLYRFMILTGAFFGGAYAGHFVTIHLIGLIAKSTFVKLTFSLSFNITASLLGILFYHETPSWC